MRMTVGDILNPATAHHRHRLQLDAEIASAKLQLQQQHQSEMVMLHDEKMAMEREKLDFQREQSENQERLEREKINIQFDKENTDHIRSLELQSIRSQSEQRQKVLDMRHTILSVRADLARQKILAKQQHEQEMEKMKLANELQMKQRQQEFNLGEAEIIRRHEQEKEQKTLQNNLDLIKLHIEHIENNASTTYEAMNDIMKRLIERALGLGQYQATDEDIERWTREAMSEYEQAEQRANI